MSPKSTPKEPSESASQAPSAVRVLKMLELLGTSGRAMRASKLAEELKIPKSSIHLLLDVLVSEGWAECDATTREFTIGLRAWEAAQGYQRARSLAERARPHMDAVRDKLGETVRLAILDGAHNVYIQKSEGSHRLVFDAAIGSRLPAYATGLGKVLLADLEPHELARRFPDNRFERLTTRTISSLAELERELATVRRRGYGEDRGEYVLGLNCVAVPVHDWSGRVGAAMSISVPSVRFNRTLRTTALALLREAADALSRELGFHAAASSSASDGAR